MRFFLLVIFMLINSPLYCEVSLSMHGNYERVSVTSTSWNGYGAGLGFGLSLAKETFFEAYADGLLHENPNTDLDYLTGTGDNFYTVHYGGKFIFLISDFVIARAGCGIAATIFKQNTGTYIENNFEALGSAGLNLPISKSTAITIEVIYRRVFTETYDLNFFGLQMGIFLKI